MGLTADAEDVQRPVDVFEACFALFPSDDERAGERVVARVQVRVPLSAGRLTSADAVLQAAEISLALAAATSILNSDRRKQIHEVSLGDLRCSNTMSMASESNKCSISDQARVCVCVYTFLLVAIGNICLSVRSETAKLIYEGLSSKTRIRPVE